MSDNGKIAVGYARVSTVGQAESGVSLDAQRERAAAWAAANGYVLADVFTDAGLSGGRADNRPALQAALDAVCKAHGALVVYSLSRLARSTKDAILISERLDRAGADLVSLSEKIDTTSAAGKMVFRMLAVLAEFERDLVAERTSAALQHKRHVGERVGAIPYGFRLAADGRRLLADEAEQPGLAMIAELRTAGAGCRRIARALNEAGVPTKKGAPWAVGSVQSIIGRAYKPPTQEGTPAGCRAEENKP
jgi:DNA invertase Pin-like site-specific DNA recombinase